ncbi:reticulon-4-interacting protein 1, mitochondrial precursor [Lentithecium fluviatile CBS 122367]|uniref:Reticulon-4-interacting protein 1, mitochondrial n=1 Tax=Lentithecium fluviatile CBS 122367 TaxID=1168545 RepID=A0A6G1IDJ1_9PLEO|nr:reticulon-4-interacting protein 1, mitochondrial precursor [Lentithecium fluviatile CBS 122367]
MATMLAWQYTTASGGLEKNLSLPAEGVPKPHIHDDQVLVEVYSAAINPADHKVPEIGIITKAMRPSTATPGMDFCGKIAEVGKKVDNFRVGEMVFGTNLGSTGHGSLAQYTAATKDMITSMPDGLKVDDVAGMGVVGLTAFQSIHPNVKEGDKVFINGGSGGTGVLSIQVAKALGCHVTTTCSGANIELCKSLGADEVIDYRTTDIIAALKGKGQIFSLAVDNVGSPPNLYCNSHYFLLPDGKFEQVGVEFSLMSMVHVTRNRMLPGFLGGGKRRYRLFLAKNDTEGLAQIGRWMQEGKIRPVIDSVFEFEEVPQAFERLKSHHSKGKVIVHVKKQ